MLEHEVTALGNKVLNGDLESVRALAAETRRLNRLIWNPHTDKFLEAVRIEAAHQRARWGDDHDKMKEDQDWFWALGWLSGKAVRFESQEKRLHHIITSAALLLNWHRFAKDATVSTIAE